MFCLHRSCNKVFFQQTSLVFQVLFFLPQKKVSVSSRKKNKHLPLRKFLFFVKIKPREVEQIHTFQKTSSVFQVHLFHLFDIQKGFGVSSLLKRCRKGTRCLTSRVQNGPRPGTGHGLGRPVRSEFDVFVT